MANEDWAIQPHNCNSNKMNLISFLLSTLLLASPTEAFTSPLSKTTAAPKSHPQIVTSTTLFSSNEADDLGEKFGGFTTKQRLREEIESPFRKVRLAFFAFSAASASVALYFSALVRSGPNTSFACILPRRITPFFSLLYRQH